MNFRLLQTLATAACAIAAIYLLSILVTGGYGVNFAGVRFDANKLRPAIVAMLGFALLRLVFRHGSIEGALRSNPGFMVFSIALIVFLANGRTISGGDSVPAKNLPLSILLHRNFYLDQLVTPGQKKIPYYLRESGGHYVSDYPVGAALMALPFYVPSVVCGVSPSSRVFAELEKVSAATIVALSALLLYLAAARVTANWMAMLLTFVYAFATTSLSVSSQALWQHGPAQLALAAAIYCLVRARDDPRWAGYAGLPLAFEVITRSADALIAAPLGLYVLIYYRREIWTFITAAIPPLLFQLWYSAIYFGSPLRIQFLTEPTAVGSQTVAPSGLWTTSFANGLAVAMLSPGRGLLFYSPIFILSLAGLVLAWRKNGDILLRYLGVGAILTILLIAKWHKTSGGESFGPRLLADLTPIMAFALFPLADSIRNRRALAVVFAMLGAWSVTANASGAFISYRGWNQWALNDADQRLWLWGDNPVVDPFRSTFDAIRIALGHRVTSRNSPDLLDGALMLLNTPPHDAAPGARVHISIRAINTGRAVWLGGRSADERGMVSLRWEWRRDGKVVGDDEARSALHLDVFPGGSMDLDASALAPDSPGHYELEISLAAEIGSQTLRPIGRPLSVPATVRPSAAVSGSAP
ncbi:hypothetical protein [Candidatus Binatus sp.]|uniref:hypothetical protein n=1 Tax=Candidatus Binatus sp. TaxID=2811406 RepID=UPI003C8456B4